MSGRGHRRTTQRDDHSEHDERFSQSNVIQRESTTSTVSTDGSMNQKNNAGQHAYRIPELADALKQTVSYGGFGAPSGSNASYQKIDVIDDSFADEINKFSSIHSRAHKTNSFGSKGNSGSNGNTKNGNGRSHTLILRFDSDGTPSFQEMSRTDVLRIAQDAAKPITPTDTDEDESDPVTSHDTTRPTGKARSVAPTSKRRQSRRLSDPRIPECKNIVDVQRVHARDIRKLDNAFAVSNEPSIVVRKQAILVNADPLRAVIMRDTCLVFVPDDAAGLLLLLKDKFREHTQPDASDMPFEFRALEALLATICRHFEADYEMASPGVSKALDRLACGHVSSGELEKLRMFKNTMNEFESQVDGVRRALMEILDNEEDLRLLYLTKLHEYPSLLGDLYSFDSEEAEVLIENYLQDIFSTRTKANLMQHRIQNTESLVMLKLDSMRNYLLGIELMFSLVAISLSIGTYITGAFGMNLNSHLQQDDHWFWGIVLFTIIIFMALTISGLLFFRKIGVLI